MAVTIVQSNTYASGNVATSGFTIATTANTGIGNTVAVVFVATQPISGVSGTAFTQLTTPSSGNPYFYLYRFTTVAAAPATLSVTLQAAGFAAAYIVETTAKSIIATTASGATGSISATGSTPPAWAPLAGDLPFGAFGFSNQTTVTPQTGWTEVANLNNTAGFFAQLEVQTGPVSTTSPQNETASATYTGTPTTFGALFIASSAPPYAFVSQDVVEALANDTANARFSQSVMEAVATDTANAHLSQQILEALAADTALGRVSQVVLEAIIVLYTRISQDVMEVLCQDTAKVRASQVVVEVLFSQIGQRRRVVEDELFTY